MKFYFQISDLLASSINLRPVVSISIPTNVYFPFGRVFKLMFSLLLQLAMDPLDVEGKQLSCEEDDGEFVDADDLDEATIFVFQQNIFSFSILRQLKIADKMIMMTSLNTGSFQIE